MKTKDELVFLNAQVEGLRRLVVALSMSLLRQNSVDKLNLFLCMEMMAMNARVTRSEAVELQIRGALDHLRALTTEPIDPVRALAAETLVYEQTPEALRQPLRTWLEQSTLEEKL